MLKKSLIFLSFVLWCFCLNGVTDLTDATFKKLVSNDESIWLVFFSAEWCGHCKGLKPEIQKLATRFEQLGVKIGHVDEKGNRKLINDHVVDHKTHMVSYPKLKIFLGNEQLGEVPGSLRNSDQIYHWFVQTYMTETSGDQKQDQL